MELDVEVRAGTNGVEFGLLGGGGAQEPWGFADEEVGVDVTGDEEPIEFELAGAIAAGEE